MPRTRTTKKSKSDSNEDETSTTINSNPVFTVKEQEASKEDGEITDIEDGKEPQPRKNQQ